MKYVDGLVLLAKEGMELSGMLVGVGKHCGIEMKVEGEKIMRISTQPLAGQREIFRLSR